MSNSFKPIDGLERPRILYGTAWKEDETERLVALALQAGFRGIDTANQRRHYDEAAVGRAISAAIQNRIVERRDLFLQTKFTFRRGQDHRLPYDPKMPIAVQVEQSCASSLDHLNADAIDSFVLHGPTQRSGLTAADWEAWRAMEAIHDSGRATFLGVSNVNLEQLEELYSQSRVRPRFVQNRCYASQGWDRRVREFCSANEIVYQGFSLLTANRAIVEGEAVRRIAKRHAKSAAQVVFRFALDIGMLPLTGTTNPDHMLDDLALDFHLEADEIQIIGGEY